VLALTDHMTGDHVLVRHAARFTSAGGALHLCHLEDGQVLARYLEVIAKIPEIPTEAARVGLQRQLLKEPRDYIASCVEVLSRVGIEVRSVVQVARELTDFEALLEAHSIDLAVLESRDAAHLTTRGRAHAIAAHVRHLPLLLI
jgi:hypothetical protein